MDTLIFAPPIAFLIFVLIFFVCSRGFSRYSHEGSREGNGLDPYACGQRDVRNYVNPNYSQFFPFAFLFTIMHVLVLVVATAPYDAPVLPVVFIGAGILCLVIIFKR
jgi:NADH:ubiquinone oxidoreductase subunit 3 (subunit A)